MPRNRLTLQVTPVTNLADCPPPVSPGCRHHRHREARIKGDGARWIRDHGPGGRLARLVAHHSCAIYEARVRGLGDILLGEFEPEATAVYDALVFCDMVTGPAGETVTLETRLAEVARRYGPNHEVTRALESARPCLTRSYLQTLARLDRMGVTQRRGEAGSPGSAGFATGSTDGSHSGEGPPRR
jgi:hypothetical protein